MFQIDLVIHHAGFKENTAIELASWSEPEFLFIQIFIPSRG